MGACCACQAEFVVSTVLALPRHHIVRIVARGGRAMGCTMCADIELWFGRNAAPPLM